MKEEKVIRTEFHIHRFMYDLGIKKSALLVYAAIYSFSTGERGLFHGSQKYLAESIGISTRTLQIALKSLLSLGLIEKYTTEDARFSGIRCVSLLKVEELKKESQREARKAQEKFARELTKKIEEREAEKPKEESVESHLKYVDDLCANINKKIKEGKFDADFPAAAPSSAEKETSERYFSENLPEHEKNTFFMMQRYEKPGDNRRFLAFGKSGGVIMTEPQYKRLLDLLPTEELMPYFVKLETMLSDNVKTGRKPPHSHYKVIKKWIEEDTAL